jgi:hypothetical protein
VVRGDDWAHDNPRHGTASHSTAHSTTRRSTHLGLAEKVERRVRCAVRQVLGVVGRSAGELVARVEVRDLHAAARAELVEQRLHLRG